MYDLRIVIQIKIIFLFIINSIINNLNMKEFLKKQISTLFDDVNFKEFNNISYDLLSQRIFFIGDEFEKNILNHKKEVSKYLLPNASFQSIMKKINEKEKELLENGLEKRELKKDNSFFICNLNDKKQKDGKGIMNINDNIIFMGEFKNDEFIKGKLIKKCENELYEIFDGEFSYKSESIIFEGLLYPPIHKDGIHENNMSLIIGQIINNDVINGEIIYTNQKGDITQIILGKFTDYKKDGECIILDYSNDTIFFGNFKENIPEGECLSWKKDSHLIVSTCINGSSTEGKCLYLKNDRGIYSGEIQINSNSSNENIFSFSDKSHGQIIYTNNDIYIGSFKNGLRTGSNNEYFIRESNSKKIKFIIEAEFEEDLIKNEAKIYFLNDQGHKILVYEGKVDSNYHLIEGKYSYISGDSFLGNFKDSLKNGEGVHTFKNGSEIKGEWKQDLMQGEYKFNYSKMDRAISKIYSYTDGKQVIKELDY